MSVYTNIFISIIRIPHGKGIKYLQVSTPNPINF